MLKKVKTLERATLDVCDKYEVPGPLNKRMNLRNQAKPSDHPLQFDLEAILSDLENVLNI